ncbi:MAG: hypothetical protein J6M24_06645 [Lachnospiraceae bacterium]|nr:hypothetical protein [Lachnospiraceae bacterium]
MFEISVYEYTKHLLRNLFVAILMSVLCMMATMVYSILFYHYNNFRPFKKLAGKVENGFFAGSSFRKEEDLKQLDGVKEVYNVKKIDTIMDNIPVTMVIYDDWILDNWTPRLKKGKMIGKSHNKKEVVISSNIIGIDVGDTIKLIAYADTNEFVYDDFVVTGILQNATLIPGSNTYRAGKESYDYCYLETSNKPGNSSFVLASDEVFKYSDLSKVKKSDLSAWAILEYDNNLNMKEREELDKAVKYEISYAGVPLKDFIRNSEKVYHSQLFLYVPIFVGVCILVLLIILNVVRIEQNMSCKDYGIFYLLGANQKKCRNIRLIVSMMNMAVSIMISVFLIIFYRGYSQKHNLTYHVGPDTVLIAGIVYIMLILINILYVMFVDRGKTPMEIYRENKKKI